MLRVRGKFLAKQKWIHSIGIANERSPQQQEEKSDLLPTEENDRRWAKIER